MWVASWSIESCDSVKDTSWEITEGVAETRQNGIDRHIALGDGRAFFGFRWTTQAGSCPFVTDILVGGLGAAWSSGTVPTT